MKEVRHSDARQCNNNGAKQLAVLRGETIWLSVEASGLRFMSLRRRGVVRMTRSVPTFEIQPLQAAVQVGPVQSQFARGRSQVAVGAVHGFFDETFFFLRQ